MAPLFLPLAKFTTADHHSLYPAFSLPIPIQKLFLWLLACLTVFPICIFLSRLSLYCIEITFPLTKVFFSRIQKSNRNNRLLYSTQWHIVQMHLFSFTPSGFTFGCLRLLTQSKLQLSFYVCNRIRRIVNYLQTFTSPPVLHSKTSTLPLVILKSTCYGIVISVPGTAQREYLTLIPWNNLIYTILKP